MEAAPPPPPPLPEKLHFHVPHQIQGKSHSNTLFKALLVLILLLFIPLFPSQAPHFVTRTIFTDFWEIIHLLFIGIAVSYGLFSRKTDQLDCPETILHSQIEDSRTYFSGISHLSSLFENASDPYEQGVTQFYVNSNCNCLLRSSNQILGQNSCIVHGGINVTSLSDLNENNVNRVHRSQYLRGESSVVVSKDKYLLGGSYDFKSLNLPIRSLRSNIVDDEQVDLKNRLEFTSTKSNGDVRVSMNLGKNYEEPSPIRWRSSSGRKMSKPKGQTHYRPHSVGEVEFERMKSKSVLASNFCSSPELAAYVSKRKAFSLPILHSKVAPVSGEVSSMDSIAEGHSSSLSNHGEEEYTIGKGKQGFEFLESDAVSSGLEKVSSKAKSVRTIKSRRCNVAADERGQCLPQIEGKFGGRFEAAGLLVKRGTGGELDDDPPPVKHQDREFDSVLPLPKAKTKPVVHSEEKQEWEEETESQVGAATTIETDAELEGSEVDRKADEFIAKFREQIKFQKLSPSDG